MRSPGMVQLTYWCLTQTRKSTAMLWLNSEPNYYSSRPDVRLHAAAIDTFHQSDKLKRPVSDCIVESSTHHHPAKRMRSAQSAFYANEPIDVDNDDNATNHPDTSMRGGTHSLLPSSEKLSQRFLGTCRLSQKKLRYVR
jgi:hypothetical protein